VRPHGHRRPAIEIVAAISACSEQRLAVKTGRISVAMPKNGTARMYTSGWPKNQRGYAQDRAAAELAEKDWAPRTAVDLKKSRRRRAREDEQPARR